MRLVLEGEFEGRWGLFLKELRKVHIQVRETRNELGWSEDKTKGNILLRWDL